LAKKKLLRMLEDYQRRRNGWGERGGKMRGENVELFVPVTVTEKLS